MRVRVLLRKRMQRVLQAPVAHLQRLAAASGLGPQRRKRRAQQPVGACIVARQHACMRTRQQVLGVLLQGVWHWNFWRAEVRLG